MQSHEIRKRFLDFFEKREHKIIPSASLVPENDPSVLFNTAGMQPLVPYLLGQAHPMGKRIADIQKCVRTGDLEDIGDNRHFSFFEMMGNWSLGDYFKEKAIEYSYKFLTNGDDKEEGDKGLGLSVDRLFITVFAGDEYSAKDDESVQIWKKQGIPADRIYFLPAEDNWWGAGDTGPCGPCSEMFYDMEGQFVGQNISTEKFIEECKKETIIEIWNDVFMAYKKDVKDEYKSEYQELKLKGLPIPKDYYFLIDLPNKNIDTGAGLERITAVMQGKQTAYETDLFQPIINTIKSISDKYIENDARIVADHIRTSIMLISDGVIPSNNQQGYVLRRLLRRAKMKMRNMHYGEYNTLSNGSVFYEIVQEVFKIYKDSNYLNKSENEVFEIIKNEEIKFRQTLENGLKEFEKWYKGPHDISNLNDIEIKNMFENEKKIMPGNVAFNLFTTFGFPIEITIEIAKEKGMIIDLEDFNKKMAEHQKLSQTASAGMFKGGLANHNEKTVRLHTAHHLLLAGLQEIVSKDIKQRGSNITEERLRMDFSFERKLTDEEKQKVEAWVNEKINQKLNVVRKEMPREEAEKIGAEMEFGAKYPDIVSVYVIEDTEGNPISKEFCGGPHVSNTSELGKFKIQKEEAVSAGVRRIKAVLE